jgi:serine/threonine protein kinase
MGVVFLARDTRLDRDVAIKALPLELADDADRLSRFEREARTLASLNHPNIASIYGLEEVDGKRYLVLEYVPGETLDDVLRHGPMPVTEALPVAKQIAEGVEAAHEKGIVHRDLKPANIKFADGDLVKVLDFGLAKAFEEKAATASDIAASPTYIPSNTPTMPGVVLGTAGYLSPEQARGRSVDRRSDIFSFGCVLYEMLAGTSVFGGETVTDSLGATLHREPTWKDLPADTPPTILLLLRRCLTKDRRRRLHDIADARVEIEEAISDPTGSSLHLAAAAATAAGAVDRSRRPAPLAAVLALALLLGSAGTWGVTRLLRSESPSPPLRRLSLLLPHDRTDIVPFLPSLSVSPDGRALAYGARPESDMHLFLRPLDRNEPTPLAGSEHGRIPSFSPDNEWIAYYHMDDDSDSLRRISVRGGPPVKLCDVWRCVGLHWGDDGWVYFASAGHPNLYRVNANGGEPEIVTTVEMKETIDEQSMDLWVRWPHALPDGRGVLFAHWDRESEAVSIDVYSHATGRSTRLISNGTYPLYSASGHLLFVRDSTLMAAPFDLESLTVTAAESPLPISVSAFNYTGAVSMGMSRDGALYYMTGATDRAAVLAAVDAQGVMTALGPWEGKFYDPVAAPDGRHVVCTEYDLESLTSDVWVFDVDRQTRSLLTTEDGHQFEPILSPDGKWVYYSSGVSVGGAFHGIYRRRLDGYGDAELVYETDRRCEITGLTADGSVAIIDENYQQESQDISLLRFGDEVVREAWLDTPAQETDSQLSPDGRWIAYTSNVSGSRLVYVSPLGLDGPRYAVSSQRGNDPFWSLDGTTLYFESFDKGEPCILAAEVLSGLQEGERFECEVPRKLFATSSNVDLVPHPDGERFIICGPESVTGQERAEIHLIQNLHGELERLAPGGSR